MDSAASRRIGGKPHLGITSGLAVIRPESLGVHGTVGLEDETGAAVRASWVQQSLSIDYFSRSRDHVGGVLGTGDGEGFSIRRPLKFGDVFRSEVGDLVSGRTV